ncbi:hypothetical protein BSZ39_11640 [Bowdeniella nasicola]|uniref:Uncharacterized protein n=1 Tax=Bowdeniella nasicola TaxID=208480 RepID=A0A1Q5PZI5_9ACTO|nr:hypothetical protein [Bowdeniella nasicola]OKL53041.1 hypothetical protein BSZ39_11640 [Bowdeniella nasicola]
MIRTSITAIIAVGLLCSCADTEDVRVPTKAFVGSWNSVAMRTTVERIDVNGSWVCPIVTHEGEESLLILPPGSTGAITPEVSFTVDGFTVTEGQTFTGAELQKYNGSYACGDREYPNAVQLPDSHLSTPSH